jgi:Subtilase family
MPDDEARSLPHIYLPEHGESESFTSPSSGGGEFDIPRRDRERHSAALERALAEALVSADAQIATRDATIAGGTEGFYLEFELPSAQAGMLDRLEDRRGRQHIELVSVHPSQTQADKITATVFVPASKRDSFFKKVEAYRTKETKSGRPQNEPLVAAIDTIRLAQARSLYTDAPDLFPAAGRLTWWEVWLRPEPRAVFENASRQLNIVLRPHSVSFAEREVVLALAPPEGIGRIIANTDAIAELRLARDTPATFMEMTPESQQAWSDELAARIVPPSADAPSVCLLDSGTTQRHSLISPALDPADQQSWDATWTVEDIGVATPMGFGGHGTEMSGIALYGDLVPFLTGSGAVELSHRLESVKILPDRGQNDPDLYGHITASAISRAEITAPDRPRAVCLAVTSSGDHWRGRPSSWSAKLDDLSYGNGIDRRLIIVSAGNIRDSFPASEYLDRNDLSPIESPAQAWNVLTVGACTEKCNIASPSYAGWQPVGASGDLSPCSRTSVSWQQDWPIKPDAVLEGGNLAIDPSTGQGDNLDDLALLTTFRRPEERPFTTTGDTSAATAQVVRMAAQILADRPELWPETVRALLVHSAEWAVGMRNHLPGNPSQTDKRTLIRRYGYGVPDLTRAIRSLTNDVTMVIESNVQPYDATDGSVKTKDMILHDLPWPEDALEALGQTVVQMKITLSYFIEPNPGERGWTQRHRYSSHGLRFAVKRSEETLDLFRRRINRAAREDEQQYGAVGGDSGWFFGPRLRNRGSLHSDIWEGTAADLAARHAIGVYPTGGWWREKPPLQRADRQVQYALVVSLRAPVQVDLYTPIETFVGIPIEVKV